VSGAAPREAPPKHVAESWFLPEEVRFAARNHALPLEALRHEITPVGLHYLLTHFDIPVIDPTSWRLTVGGLVARPLSLSLDDIRSRPSVTLPVTMECAGNGRAFLAPRPVSQPWLTEAVGTARWTGTPLAAILDEAGPLEDGVDVVFTGADRGLEGGLEQNYERGLSVEEAMRENILLAYEINGMALPPQHGFPVRLLVPGWYGMTSVKWLREVSVSAEPFEGYQMTRAYRLKQSDEELGEPLQRILPRALMAPPGIPEFATRDRYVPLETCELSGRAWSGHGPVTRVEVSTDGGRTWADAEVGPAPSAYAWHPWSFSWDPPVPGEYEVRCRATDAAGNVQPDDPPWNWGGYANNAVQRVPVIVRGGTPPS
jgi:sulfane dehydrogenase subunit SoxC